MTHRILLAGAWKWPWYEEACARALMELGNEVHAFSWTAGLLSPRGQSSSTGGPGSAVSRFQHRFLVGPEIWRVNRVFANAVFKINPDIIFAFRATHIFPGTLRLIHSHLPRTLCVQWCNDDPYSPTADRLLWRHLKRSVPQYDLHFSYRTVNTLDLKGSGAGDVELLFPYFIPERDYREEPSEDDSSIGDVIFVGHYEPDGRLEYLEHLARTGVSVRIFGALWNGPIRALPRESPLSKVYPVTPLLGSDYRRAISGSKIALCFLSKLNRDTYTRRNFEIPAMGTFMLSEYSDELASLFTPEVEADYFRSSEELNSKVSFYLENDALRRAIAARAQQRVWEDGHDVQSRMAEAMRHIQTKLLSRAE